MIHEIAHTGTMDHGVGHNAQMIKVEQYLADEGLLDYYKDALLDILSRHESTFTAMKEEYDKSTTTNIAKSLEDINRAKSARGDVSGGEDQAGKLRAGEGRGRGEPVSACSADVRRSSEQLKAPQFVPLTAEVDKFFAKSKARDADGSLLPLLHGTTATGPKGEGLTQIKLSKEGSLGGGIYLTPSTDFASDYSGSPNVTLCTTPAFLFIAMPVDWYLSTYRLKN